MTTVYFVRHARSIYNEEGKMAGSHDPPLSVSGRREAELTAQYLRSIPFDAAYSSPLSRALETARILWQPRHQQIEVTPDIRELDMGDFSGRTWADVVDAFPAIFGVGPLSFWEIFSRNRIPNQENYDGAVRRIMTFFSRLERDHCDERVMVVAHKGVLEIFLSQTIGFDPSVDWFDLDGASVTTFKIAAGKKTRFQFVNFCPSRQTL
jgi:alpha-ribazole phosphatase